MKFGGAIVVCCVVSVGLTGSGQSRNRNYVKESVMTVRFKENPCTDYYMARSTVRYYDGLGRPVQSAQVSGRYAVLDIVSASEYDGSGRPYKSWLPVESTYAGGDFIDNHTVNSYAVSIYDNNSPYSIIEYDRTPDRREIATYYPGDDYSSGWNYDANGNRTTDPAKGITAITYDVNNRPTKMIFADGSFVENRYRSDGTLYGIYEHEALMSTLTDSGTARRQFRNVTTYYLGDLVFTNTLPSRLYIDGGYIDFDIEHGIPPVYHYYIADNQGSTRVIIDENGNTVQATDYSAYGVPSTRMATFPADNRLHLGLQWQATKGIFGYYNNARFRDPTLAGTFLQVDPLAFDYSGISPYSYCGAKPLNAIDKTGMDIWYINNAGKIKNYAKDESRDEIRIVGQYGEFLLDLPNKSLSLVFDYGTIKQFSWDGQVKNTNDFWRVKGDDNAQKLFEFMSEHISTAPNYYEVGWAKTGQSGPNGLNFIGIGHKIGSEPAISQLYSLQLYKEKHFREWIHSHPVDATPSKPDEKLKRQIRTNRNKNKLFTPKFSIYIANPKSELYGKYIHY